VNNEDPRCIEIWNLVFIQFNANVDGTFSPLPQCHVDTGMGFERVTAIIQGTKNLTDFSGTVSNYETDIFRPIFDEIEKLSGKKYASTLPAKNSQPSTLNPQLPVDIAFRVIADHIRTLSFAIADGIIPSTKAAGTFCDASCAALFATAARLDSTNHSFSNWSVLSRERWATCFPRSARNKKQSKKQFAAKKKR